MTLDLPLPATEVFAQNLNLRLPGNLGLVQYLCETRKILYTLCTASRNIYCSVAQPLFDVAPDLTG